MKRIKPEKSSILLGPLVGGFWGLLNFTWDYTFESFLAGFFSGFAFGLVTVIIFYIFKIDSKLKLLLTTIAAGYFGGLLWGILFNPGISIFYAGLIGSGVATIFYFYEIYLIKEPAFIKQ